MTAIPQHNGVPVENVIILGGTTTIIEAEGRQNYLEREVFRYDLSTGGNWSTRTEIVTETSTGDYTSPIPVEKQDLIWEIYFGSKRMAVTISLFNETTNITRVGGLPVPVSPQAFKVTYLLSNWTWYNSSVQVVFFDLNSNILTDRRLVDTINQPHVPEPATYNATYPGKWEFFLSFERWTMVNGILDYVGDLLPDFSVRNESDPKLRNAQRVLLSYATLNYHSIEYDPTGLFSLFSVSQPGPQKGRPPYWVIGLVFGIVGAAFIVAALIIYLIPSARNAVFPSRQRAEQRKQGLESQRSSSWVPSTTPPSE